jgi:hypothetical protein
LRFQFRVFVVPVEAIDLGLWGDDWIDCDLSRRAWGEELFSHRLNSLLKNSYVLRIELRQVLKPIVF